MTGPNFRGLAWIAAAPFVLLAIVVYNEPRLFLWLVAVAVLLISGAVWVVAIGFKVERDEARAELARRDREDAARMESRLLSGETVPVPLVPFTSLPDWERELLEKQKPDLRIVPDQRAAEHDRLAMSREEWAAIERETRDL